MNQPPRRRTILGRGLTPQPAGDTLWSELCHRISNGTVLPIVSANVASDYLLAPLLARLPSDDHTDAPTNESTIAPPSGLMVNEELAYHWAESLNYPLSERHLTLAQVAQYNRVKSDDDEQAKRGYLSFLKTILLTLVEEVGVANAEYVADLHRQINERRYSDLIWELNLPGQTADNDPLRLLARLNLPVYVTTSYDDLLERAIRIEGRECVRTDICGSHRIRTRTLCSEHCVAPDFQPSPQEPVVYHLHGLEEYPTSLVLSEDDYLEFLVRVTRPINTEAPEIPLYLREALTNSTLLLLGYRLQDWDFRTTFFGLIGAKEVQQKSLPERPFSVALQLSPRDQDNATNPDEAERYLTAYFKKANFRVVWGNSTQFMQKLWQQWNIWRQGGMR